MYGENKITKFQLTEIINKNILAKMDDTIEKLADYLKMYALRPLRHEVRCQKFLKNHIRSSILYPFIRLKAMVFDSVFIETAARTH